MKKVLALVMAALMVVGFAVPAAAGWAGSEDLNVSYDAAQKTLSITVEAAAFNEVCANKAVTVDDINALLPQDLVAAFKADGIAGVVANAAFKGMMTRKEFFEIFPKSVFANPDDISLTKIQKNPSMIKGISADVYADVASIKLNDVELLTQDAALNDVIDVAKLEEGFLKGIPATEAKLCEDPTATFEFKFDFFSEQTTFKVVVGFAGSDSELATMKSNLSAIAERVEYTIDGQNVTVSGTAGEKLCAYVTTVLESTKISDSKKLKLLVALNGTLEDVLVLLDSYDLNGLQADAEALGSEFVTKLNEIIDKLPEDKAQAAFEKGVKALNKALESSKDKEIASIYQGEGVFKINGGRSYTAEELIALAAEKVSEVEQLGDFFTGTAALNVDATVTCEDIFRTTFHIGDESFNVYVPEGTTFESLMAILAGAADGTTAKELTKIAAWGNSTDNGTTILGIVDATAGEDMDVYAVATISFKDDAGTTSKIFPIGYKLQASDIPTAAAKTGYTVGDWYLEGNKSVAPLNYEVAEDATFVVDYTADTTAEETTEPTNPPTGIEDVAKVGKNNSNMILSLAIVAVLASAGVVIVLKKKKAC